MCADRAPAEARPADLTVDACVVGGGPAGSLLAYLLARRGHEVLLVEREETLQREFRGETVAAASVQTLTRLGFAGRMADSGYLGTDGVTMWMEGRRVFGVDYRRFPIGVTPIDMPQPAMIGMFVEAAEPHRGFTRLTGTRFTDLVVGRSGEVVGARLRRRSGETLTVGSRVVVGADGRFSKVRVAAGIAARVQPMERDFLQFRVPRPAWWGRQAELVVDRDRHLVVLPTYPDFLRIGTNLPKRGLGELRRAGFPAFKAGITGMSSRLAPLVDEHLRSWDDTAFLEIFTTEVADWARDGLVLIGDASHTCTPILGQGVNVAIQDAVCLAPVLSGALRAAPNGAIPATAFAGFVAERKAHKGKVTRYQRIQEAALAASSPPAVLARRAKYRVLDALPVKYRIFDGVLNARHRIADEDLPTAGEPVPPGRPVPAATDPRT